MIWIWETIWKVSLHFLFNWDGVIHWFKRFNICFFFQNEWKEHPQVLHPQVNPSTNDSDKDLPTQGNNSNQTQCVQDCPDQECPSCVCCPHPCPLSLHARGREIPEPTFLHRQCWAVQVSKYVLLLWQWEAFKTNWFSLCSYSAWIIVILFSLWILVVFSSFKCLCFVFFFCVFNYYAFRLKTKLTKPLGKLLVCPSLTCQAE